MDLTFSIIFLIILVGLLLASSFIGDILKSAERFALNLFLILWICLFAFIIGNIKTIENSSFLIINEVKIEDQNYIVTFKNSNLKMYKDINCNYKPNDTLWIKK